MDKEKNVLDIENEEGLYAVDEENKIQRGEEIFTNDEECFSTNEENEKYLEENTITSSETIKLKKEKSRPNSLTHHLGASLSVPVIAVTLVGTITIIGTAAGIIPSAHSNHVTNFLSRSSELGFSIEKEPSQTILMTLSNQSYSVSEELTSINQIVFSDLTPHTIYDLDVYDISDGINKKIYSADYLTKSSDAYYASVRNNGVSDDKLYFSVFYQGENIEYVTVNVLGDDLKSIYLYEGSKKQDFVIDVNGNSNVSCRISINGTIVHFEQLVTPEEGKIDPPETDIPLERISFEQESIDMEVGQSIQLVPIFYPENATNKDVIWRTNVSYISVSEDGIVTALSAGETGVVTVTSADNGNIYASCVVNVPYVYLESISINDVDDVLEMRVGESIALTLTFYPANATNKEVDWFVNDDYVSIDGNGVLTALSAGTGAYVTVNSYGNSQIYDYFIVNVS